MGLYTYVGGGSRPSFNRRRLFFLCPENILLLKLMKRNQAAFVKHEIFITYRKVVFLFFISSISSFSFSPPCIPLLLPIPTVNRIDDDPA